MTPSITPTGVERTFDENDIIVSKTDLKGRITYANHTFMDVSGYTEDELLGKPHNLIRHPDMPRCVFKLLWDTIADGREIFAYVVNLCKNGDHYWVLAHVTPTFDGSHQIVGYHSSRRVPERSAVSAIEGLYAKLRSEEARQDDKKSAIDASTQALAAALAEHNVEYDEFVFSL